MTTIQDAVQRIRAEYLEMPGLRLKAEQVQRLCAVERSVCQKVLDTLVDGKFLYRRADGRYGRVLDGLFARQHSARADLGDLAPDTHAFTRVS